MSERLPGKGVRQRNHVEIGREVGDGVVLVLVIGCLERAVGWARAAQREDVTQYRESVPRRQSGQDAAVGLIRIADEHELVIVGVGKEIRVQRHGGSRDLGDLVTLRYPDDRDFFTGSNPGEVLQQVTRADRLGSFQRLRPVRKVRQHRQIRDHRDVEVDLCGVGQGVERVAFRDRGSVEQHRNGQPECVERRPNPDRRSGQLNSGAVGGRRCGDRDPCRSHGDAAGGQQRRGP
ncbi:hypothetical protein BN970_01605 [Mycolicibacterium conceptionense]|uniref:Uncharacterized protein n=1 Tax=Mycolicibacterium conceptionense TaxID=451644 RepID=A0A0U1D7C8_9MYCO|nr:hypothetical protein BN970_01605 [Mycolicibacterium conceptionense]